MPKTYSEEVGLSLFNLDFKGEYPLGRLVSQLIHVAGEHATTYGFGIEKLISEGRTWVLSRLSIEMLSEIDVSEPLNVSTGILSYEGLSTERVLLFSQESVGEVGRALSRWVAIDLKSRRPIPISEVLDDSSLIVDFGELELPSIPRRLFLPEFEPTLHEVYSHQVRYSDLDINRHVNSAIWVQLAQDAIPVKELVDRRLKRAHLYFIHEGQEGDILQVERAAGACSDFMRIRREGVDCFQLLIEWQE